LPSQTTAKMAQPKPLAALLAEWTARKRAALAIELAALLRQYDVSNPETAAAVMLKRLDAHEGD
jgi:hypothetical protein